MRYEKLTPEEKASFDDVCKRLQPIPKMDSKGEPIIVMDKVMGSYLKKHYNEATFQKPKYGLIKDHEIYPWPRFDFIDPKERLKKAIKTHTFDLELRNHMKETEQFLKWVASRNNTNNSPKNENNEEKIQMLNANPCPDNDGKLISASPTIRPESI